MPHCNRNGSSPGVSSELGQVSSRGRRRGFEGPSVFLFGPRKQRPKGVDGIYRMPFWAGNFGTRLSAAPPFSASSYYQVGCQGLAVERDSSCDQREHRAKPNTARSVPRQGAGPAGPVLDWLFAFPPLARPKTFVFFSRTFSGKV